MKKLILLLFIPLISFSQNKFNGAKYVYYENNDISKSIKNILNITRGFFIKNKIAAAEQLRTIFFWTETLSNLVLCEETLVNIKYSFRRNFS